MKVKKNRVTFEITGITDAAEAARFLRQNGFEIVSELPDPRSPTPRAAVPAEQNGASLLVTWDNGDDGGMDVDELKKRLRGKHGWLTVKYFANGQAQMFIAPHSNRSAGG